MKNYCLTVKEFPSGGDGKVLELNRGRILCVFNLVKVLMPPNSTLRSR